MEMAMEELFNIFLGFYLNAKQSFGSAIVLFFDDRKAQREFRGSEKAQKGSETLRVDQRSSERLRHVQRSSEGLRKAQRS